MELRRPRKQKIYFNVTARALMHLQFHFNCNPNRTSGRNSDERAGKFSFHKTGFSVASASTRVMRQRQVEFLDSGTTKSSQARKGLGSRRETSGPYQKVSTVRTEWGSRQASGAHSALYRPPLQPTLRPRRPTHELRQIQNMFTVSVLR